jgi:predicted TIM-barrel fold metal-dependent hydrolase
VAKDLFAGQRVIDVDTHLTEPPDVWTARVSSKWGDAIPHIEEVRGEDMWMSSGHRIGKPGASSMAGFDGVLPDSPPTYAEIPASAYDPVARLALMDDEGIEAQVLYPNVGGFGAASFRRLGDPDMIAECLSAYNDFLVDWTSADPKRLIPVVATPFWDVPFAVTEIERCIGLGHRAVNFCNQPEGHGEPPLASAHWDPIWAAAQDAGVPISFHIGGGDIGGLMRDADGIGWRSNFAKVSSLLMVDNMRCVADLIFGGVCHRFPDLKFVSVESGVGWIPGALETFDWQWRNGGIAAEHPEYDLIPSEYFRRQIYGCFWFEGPAARSAIEAYPDNILYETDYPHPTCQYPGPRTPAQRPRDYASAVLGPLSRDLQRKVLFESAAALYRVA